MVTARQAHSERRARKEGRYGLFAGGIASLLANLVATKNQREQQLSKQNLQRELADKSDARAAARDEAMLERERIKEEGDTRRERARSNQQWQRDKRQDIESRRREKARFEHEAAMQEDRQQHDLQKPQSQSYSNSPNSLRAEGLARQYGYDFDKIMAAAQSMKEPQSAEGSLIDFSLSEKLKAYQAQRNDLMAAAGLAARRGAQNNQPQPVSREAQVGSPNPGGPVGAPSAAPMPGQRGPGMALQMKDLADIFRIAQDPTHPDSMMAWSKLREMFPMIGEVPVDVQMQPQYMQNRILGLGGVTLPPGAMGQSPQLQGMGGMGPMTVPHGGARSKRPGM